MKKFKNFLCESAPPRDYHHDDSQMKSYDAHTEDVPIHWLKKLPGNHFRHSNDHINAMAHDIKTNGIRSPLIINVGKDSRTAKLGEGNHRLEAIHRAGFTHAPARVIVGSKYGSEHGDKANYHHDLIPKTGEYHRSDDKPSNVFHSLKKK